MNLSKPCALQSIIYGVALLLHSLSLIRIVSRLCLQFALRDRVFPRRQGGKSTCVPARQCGAAKYDGLYHYVRPDFDDRPTALLRSCGNSQSFRGCRVDRASSLESRVVPGCVSLSL